MIDINMTVAQLREYAAENGVELGTLSRKQDIFDTIQAAISSKPAADEAPQEEPPATPLTETTGAPENEAGTNIPPADENAPQVANEATGDKIKTDEEVEANQTAENVTENITESPFSD